MLKISDISRFDSLWWAYTLLASLALGWMSYLLPLNSWDLLGHLGAAFALDSNVNESTLMQRSFAEASLHMSAVNYNELVSGNIHREVWSSDPESFRQLLPFYAPRILVTGPAFLANEAGFSSLLTMRAMSSIWAAAALAVGALAFRSLLRPGHTWLVVPIVALFSGLLEVARFEGADALACLAFVTFCYFYLRGSLWALLLIVLMPLSRSDMVIMSCIASLACLLTFPRARLLTMLAGAVAALVYFSLNAYFQNYGWAKQFYVVHQSYLTYPEDTDVTITLGVYLAAVFKGLVAVIYDKAFLGFVAVAIVMLLIVANKISVSGLKLWVESSGAQMKIYSICALCIAYLVLHYLAFPHVLTRYFSGQYYILFLCGLALLSQKECTNKSGE